MCFSFLSIRDSSAYQIPLTSESRNGVLQLVLISRLLKLWCDSVHNGFHMREMHSTCHYRIRHMHITNAQHIVSKVFPFVTCMLYLRMLFVIQGISTEQIHNSLKAANCTLFGINNNDGRIIFVAREYVDDEIFLIACWTAKRKDDEKDIKMSSSCSP